MQFTKIDDAPLRANNLSKTGAVYYWMWHDTNENSYVQISHLSGGRGKNNGTFSKYLFALDDIGMKKPTQDIILLTHRQKQFATTICPAIYALSEMTLFEEARNRLNLALCDLRSPNRQTSETKGNTQKGEKFTERRPHASILASIPASPIIFTVTFHIRWQMLRDHFVPTHDI